MDDLDIRKSIADIEGHKNIMQGNTVIVNYNGSGEVEDWEEYNPLVDDALCFQLMVKYDVTLTVLSSDFYRTNGKYSKLYEAVICKENYNYFSSENVKCPKKAIC